MSEFRSALKAYNLEKALAADRNSGCLVIDVGHDENGHSIPSHAHVIERVDHVLHYARAAAFAATKLYIVGDWNLTPIDSGDELDEEAKETKARLDSVVKWGEATEKIGQLLKQMGNLQELTWISGLPFTAAVWKMLPTELIKLVIDVGEPVRLEQDGDFLYRSYITPDEMQLLQEQVKLKELRLLNVHNSFQPLVWEAVFRNTSAGGMRVLDIQMAVAPIVRSEEWKKAKDVAGLTVALEDSPEKFYKGMDGKGILHYAIGTGEYLDDYSIRKARIASGLDEATPLPLWCLKLDGFVIDHLPFGHELSRIVLLTCGDNCIDSGLRAPKTGRAPQNKWSKAVNNAISHCLIKWPNWTGIFDDQGDQRNKLGLVIPHDVILSTPLDEFSPNSPTVPLTKESLHMKELGEALGDVKMPDYFNDAGLLGEPAISRTPMSVFSNESERGSDVPTPTVISSTVAYSPRITTVDGTTLTTTTSFTESDTTTVSSFMDTISPTSTFSSFDDTVYPTSTLSSFEEVSTAIAETDSNVATDGSGATATEENKTPKKSTFAHKVRRSLDWLTRSS
ncbi:hypothetical protein HBI71_064910 [Parastagonospora nodorum]|nr:hypothetical protein HBI71_064910 [Parastagonospora nodorum]KAH5439681.1 hypothetical protein HBI47_046480 [Parastagonospora nodorum]